MSTGSGKQRGAEPQDAARTRRIRKRWLVALVGTGLLAGAIAIALAVRDESCDIGETLNPQDAAIICALRGQEPSACPTVGMSRDECEATLEQFDTNHGRG